MLFHTQPFVLFLAAALAGFALCHRSIPLRNLFLLALSYVFYGWWDPRFLALIVVSTTIDFIAAQRIARTDCTRTRRTWLLTSLAGNLGLLGFFKYWNFFAASLVDALATFGWSLSPVTLSIILPVGISFYTFQSIAYTVDVYRGQLRPERNPVTFAAYIAFFPQLVAGPIERAASLLTQFQRPTRVTPNDVLEGLWLFLWGLTKKVIVADSLAPLADQAFAGEPGTTGSMLTGLLAFSLQIYGDFSGYSAMARGMARWFGFRLSVNFLSPYTATNLADFWRRWHRTLSFWLRDYLYIPLGGSRGRRHTTARNLLLTMILGGLWHGAAWTFVIWGLLHGLGLILHHAVNRALPRLAGLLITQLFVLYGWIFFRSPDLATALVFQRTLLSGGAPEWIGLAVGHLALVGLPMLVVDHLLVRYRREDTVPVRHPVTLGLLLGLLALINLFLRPPTTQAFLYFQF
jgi:D-alanyl-lipoteichoic acid acyltransferase DltB (MBOAT superfamily)